VSDATRDDRFARDPYYADVDCCSLLAVPLLSGGALRALLLLENHLVRVAFTTGRLDAVKLIAGQLAVSLDNAKLYAEYRQIASEQAALRRVATLAQDTGLGHADGKSAGTARFAPAGRGIFVPSGRGAFPQLEVRRFEHAGRV
jgi:GAF domain-containing protein